jgi:hypothetical protein
MAKKETTIKKVAAPVEKELAIDEVLVVEEPQVVVEEEAVKPSTAKATEHDGVNQLFTLKRIKTGEDVYLAGQFIRVELKDYVSLQKSKAAVDVGFNPASETVDNTSPPVTLTGNLIEIFPGGRDLNP